VLSLVFLGIGTRVYADGGQLDSIAIIATSLAVVMGTLWGPFTQNLIRYESGNITVAGGTALLSRSVEYRARGISMHSDGKARLVHCVDKKTTTNQRGCDLVTAAYHQDPFLEFDIMSALMTAPNDNVNHPKFLCSTGNCTWDRVATLGFCSRCTDLTPQIELACTAYNLTSFSAPGVGHKCTAVLPEGSAGLYYIDTDGPATEALMNITQVGGTDGLRYHAIRMLPPYNMDPSPRPLVTLANFSATECSLSLCVLSLQASVSSGTYSETVLDTFTEPPPPGTHWMIHKLQPPWGSEHGIDPAANLSFSLMESLWPDWSYSRFLLDNYTIPGWAKTLDSHKGIVFCVQGPDPNCTEDPMPGLIFNANYTPSVCGSPNADTFACAMRGVAAALTKTLRNAGVTANGTGIGDQFLVQGRAETAATFVRVRWGWIALPCAVWVLGLVAWAVVASQTRRMGLPTWRDDPLPLAFLYREEGGSRPGETQLRDGLLAADDSSTWAYEKVAEGMNVQLLEVPCQPGGGSGVMRLVLTEQGG
jgi:hypothetical protein